MLLKGTGFVEIVVISKACYGSTFEIWSTSWKRSHVIHNLSDCCSVETQQHIRQIMMAVANMHIILRELRPSNHATPALHLDWSVIRRCKMDVHCHLPMKFLRLCIWYHSHHYLSDILLWFNTMAVTHIIYHVHLMWIVLKIFLVTIMLLVSINSLYQMHFLIHPEETMYVSWNIGRFFFF